MIVGGKDLDVNVEEELEPYLDLLDRVEYKGDELMANSPFREENNPSFSVNLETGVYNDFGGQGFYKSGNIVKLISFLSDTPMIDVEMYLEEKYGRILEDTDALTLNIDLSPKVEKERIYEPSELSEYMYRSNYLGNRGISEKVQKAFNVGYDRERKAIALPWKNIQGQIINVKFRHVRRKSFWYMPDGDPIKKHVYGLSQIEKQDVKTAVVTESEIDALYLWTNKIPAIALGSANMSSKQEQLINSSGLTEIVLGLDNDKAGYSASENIKNRLIKSLKVSKLEIPTYLNDVNEVNGKELQSLYLQRKPVQISFLDI